MINKQILHTACGDICVCATENEIYLLQFTNSKYFKHIYSILASTHNISETINSCIEKLAIELNDYFTGSHTVFTLSLNTDLGTPFQRAVWAHLQTVPYSQTATYASVAQAIGKPTAARAVAQAIARNPIHLLIPCHRIVAAHSIGGFAAGIDIKTKLLNTEHAQI